MQLNVNGNEAYCYTGGKTFDRTLPTAIFIHGAQHDHSVWALQTRYFAHHGFGVLAVDLPGHGRSKGKALHTIEAMATWLLAVMDTVGIQQALLIGHSMGALIALETTSQARSRVTKLALLGATYPMKVSNALLTVCQNDSQMAIDMVNIWSHSSIAQKPSFPGPGFYTMGGSKRLMQRIAKLSPDNVFHTDFLACNAYANGNEAANSVLCPTLFLCGKNDLMTPPKTTKAFIAAIPHSRVVTFEHCGHQIMAEQPNAVLHELFAFSERETNPYNQHHQHG